MNRSDNVRPIIIKRKKVVAAGGHHGGAWKVAYADFVTAMMAFFLMLWLLGSVSDDQRKGIADYFSPTLSVDSNSAGGDGVLGGRSLSPVDSVSDDIATREAFAAETRALQDVADAFEALAGQSARAEAMLQHVNIRLTDEGLVFELFARPDAPLFVPRSAAMEPRLEALLGMLAEAMRMVVNPLAVGAHSQGFSAVVRDNPVWPLTVDRAQAGFQPARMRRVTGHADRALAVPVNPMAPRNNRLMLTLLRSVPAPGPRLGGS